MRLFENNIEGTTTSSINSTDTTLNSAELANLPVVASPDFIMLTLDPDAAGNGPEIVKVTAHTSAATSATIVRGQEDTSAASHASGSKFGLYQTRDILKGLQLPAASIFRTSATQTLSNNTWTKIELDATLLNTNTVIFTPDIVTDFDLTLNADGVYLIGGGIRWDGDSSGTSRNLRVRLNGTSDLVSEYTKSSTVAAETRHQAWGVRSLSATDVLTLEGRHDDGANFDVLSGGGVTFLTAIRLLEL